MTPRILVRLALLAGLVVLATGSLSAATTPGSHLILPYFEVEADPSGTTTLWSVRNVGYSDINLLVDYFDEKGVLKANESFVVGGQQVQARNVRQVSGIPSEGYATFQAVGTDPANPAVLPKVIHGDYYWVEPGNDFASGAPLIRDHVKDIAAGVGAPGDEDLCSRWETRYFDGGAFSGGTDFIFYLSWDRNGPEPSQPFISGELFFENGIHHATVGIGTTNDIEAINTSLIRVSVPTMPPAGSFQWSFAPGIIGHVVALHRADGRYSLSIPGACLD